MVVSLKIRRKILMWIFTVFLSIFMLILGYVYAYVIFPNNLLRLGMERLSNIARESYELLRNFSLDLLLRVTLIIFMNNAIANTLFALPFLSPIIYAYIITFTGAVLRFYIDSINVYIGASLGGEILMLFLITPHTYIEFLAYAITLTESVSLSASIVRTSVSKRIILSYIAMLGLSYTVLFIAAFIEALTMFLIKP